MADTWLTASVLQGEGDATIIFTAPSYDLPDGRATLVTLRCETIRREIPVTQLAAEPRVEADRKEVSFGYAGGEETLHILSNADWEIAIGEDDAWLTAEPAAGTGDGEVVLRAGLYYANAPRNAEIVLRSGGAEQRIIVAQSHPVTAGVWILSEGSAMEPTADLAWYDAAEGVLYPMYYSRQNGEAIGQIANDMGLYGSKLYVAVSGPPTGLDSSVKVIDPENGKLLKTIPMRSMHNEGDVTRQLAFHGGKVYATSYFSGGKGAPGEAYLYYGGVVRIDTASLEIEAAVRVGDKPEGIACRGDELFVCINESGNGKTVAVVDIPTFSVTRTIPVPENPVYIRAAGDGTLYFSTLEIFTGENRGRPSGFHRLDPGSGSVETYEGMRAGRFAVTDRYVFTGEFSWSTYADTANRLDRESGEVVPLDLQHPYFMIYSFDENPATGDIYVGGSGEDVVFLNREGGKLESFKVGVGFVNRFVPVFR